MYGQKSRLIIPTLLCILIAATSFSAIRGFSFENNEDVTNLGTPQAPPTPLRRQPDLAIGAAEMNRD